MKAVPIDRTGVMPGIFAEASRRRIGPVDVVAVDEEAAVAACLATLDSGHLTRLAFANAHCVNLAAARPDYREALAAFAILPDGVGLDIASRLLHGAPFPANLNGTDFVPRLLAAASRPLRVALIGGEPGIAMRAAERLRRSLPQHEFLAISNGFFAPGRETEERLERLAEARADIVLVALGVPGQELFIARHLTASHARLAIGVGALLDFIAGKVPRAPSRLRRLRLEWVYRLALEPGRLSRRYILGNPLFLARVLGQKLGRS